MYRIFYGKVYMVFFVFSLLFSTGYAVNNKIEKKTVLVKRIFGKIIKEKGKNILIINKNYVSLDKKDRFVYKIKGDFAYKTYLKCKNYGENFLKVYEGLQNGDEIIEKILIKIGNEYIKGNFISESDRVLISIMEKNKRGVYVNRKKNSTNNIIKRKINFEIGIGYSNSDFTDLYLKDKSYEYLLKQYAGLLGVSFTSDGTYPELSFFKPIEIDANYKIADNLYINCGVSFASISSNSDLAYSLSGINIEEIYNYDFFHKLSYINPYLGVARRFNDFYVYTNIGINSLKYSYKMSKKFNEGNYWEKISEEIIGKGKAFSLVFGVKYKKKIYKQIKGYIKFEYKLSKFSSMDADYNLNGTNSEGKTINKTYSGSIYTYSMNPYNSTDINSWSVFDELPDTTWTDNFEKMIFKLSAVKISFGLSF